MVVNIAIVVGNALLVYFVYHVLIVMIAKAVFLHSGGCTPSESMPETVIRKSTGRISAPLTVA